MLDDAGIDAFVTGLAAQLEAALKTGLASIAKNTEQPAVARQMADGMIPVLVAAAAPLFANIRDHMRMERRLIDGIQQMESVIAGLTAKLAEAVEQIRVLNLARKVGSGDVTRN